MGAVTGVSRSDLQLTKAEPSACQYTTLKVPASRNLDRSHNSSVSAGRFPSTKPRSDANVRSNSDSMDGNTGRDAMTVIIDAAIIQGFGVANKNIKFHS